MEEQEPSDSPGASTNPEKGSKSVLHWVCRRGTRAALRSGSSMAEGARKLCYP